MGGKRGKENAPFQKKKAVVLCVYKFALQRRGGRRRVRLLLCTELGLKGKKKLCPLKDVCCISMAPSVIQTLLTSN